MEIINVYKQELPSMKFIGKKYSDDDRENGGFGAKWGEWFQNGYFEMIEKTSDFNSLKETYEDIDAYIGMMRWKDNEPFQYWIGIFTPSDTKVPEGFDYIDFPESKVGACWIKGQEWDIYGKEYLCAEKLKENAYEIINDDHDACWFFERYVCPRFTTPDSEGNVILDICHFIK